MILNISGSREVDGRNASCKMTVNSSIYRRIKVCLALFWKWCRI